MAPFFFIHTSSRERHRSVSNFVMQGAPCGQSPITHEVTLIAALHLAFRRSFLLLGRAVVLCYQLAFSRVWGSLPGQPTSKSFAPPRSSTKTLLRRHVKTHGHIPLSFFLTLLLQPFTGLTSTHTLSLSLFLHINLTLSHRLKLSLLFFLLPTDHFPALAGAVNHACNAFPSRSRACPCYSSVCANGAGVQPLTAEVLRGICGPSEPLSFGFSFPSIVFPVCVCLLLSFRD